MPSDAFWSLIGSLRGRVSEHAFADLRAKLLQLDHSEVVEFRTELGEAVRALTTPAHLAQTVQDPSEVGIPGSTELPLVGTAALGVACAVIAEGRDAFEDAVAHPDHLAGVRPIAAAVRLMDVAADVYQELTGDAYMGAIPRLSDGFMDVLGTAHLAEEKQSEHYATRLRKRREVGVDPAWASWWSPSGYDRMILYFAYRDNGKFRVTVRKPKTDPASVQVDVVLPPRPESLPPAEAVRLADEDFWRFMATVGERLALPAPPPLP